MPSWTTKEIIQYARWHSYTPTSLFETIKPKSDADKNVHEMVRTELEREQSQCNVISLNAQVKNWLETFETQTKSTDKLIADNEIINVDEYIDDALDKNHTQQSKRTQLVNGATVYPIPNALSTETMWINDICRRLQINLQPELLVEGELLEGFLAFSSISPIFENFIVFMGIFLFFYRIFEIFFTHFTIFYVV